MVRKDKRSDIKLGIPFLDADGIPEKPRYSIDIHIYTTPIKKFVAQVIYNTLAETWTYVNCAFKDIQYSDIEELKPILVIALDSPNFQPGRLNCTITIKRVDTDFNDNVQVTVKEVRTNIEIV